MIIPLESSYEGVQDELSIQPIRRWVSEMLRVRFAFWVVLFLATTIHNTVFFGIFGDKYLILEPIFQLLKYVGGVWYLISK